MLPFFSFLPTCGLSRPVSGFQCSYSHFITMVNHNRTSTVEDVSHPISNVEKGNEISSIRDIGDSDQSSQPYEISSREYRKLIWKLDLHLLPPLFALWFVSLIDRINIGSANIFGIQKDLKMNPKSNQFNVVLIIVLIGLITCEVPSNWLLKKTSPSKVLALESLVLGEYSTILKR